MLSILKKSKTNYYNQYFEGNMSNMKNTWKGIKSILTINNIYSDFPKCLSSNGCTKCLSSNISTKLKYQLSLIIILHQLLKKQK